MPATLRQAHDQILALLHAALPSLVIQYPDMPSPPARPPQASWARVMVEDSDDAGSNTLVGSRGNRRYETNGILTVQIFALGGDGRREAQRLAEAVLRAYRGRKTTGGVWFRRERVRDVGPDGTWYHVNVIVEYQYDTIETGTERGIGGAVALAPVAVEGDADVDVQLGGGFSVPSLVAAGESTAEDFHPLDELSLVAWWSASRGISGHGTSGFVWADQVAPPANQAQSTVGRQPAIESGPARLAFAGSGAGAGAGDSVAAATAAKLEPAGAFHLMAWVHFLSLDSTDRYLWAQWDAGDLERLTVRYRATYTEVVFRLTNTTVAFLRFAAPPTDVPVCDALIFAAGAVVFKRDGVILAPTVISGTAPVTLHNPGSSVQLGTFQAGGGTNFVLHASIYQVYAANAVLAPHTETALMAFEAPKALGAASSHNLVLDGDSRTFGTGASAGSSYGHQLAALLGSTWRVVNVGIGGKTTQDLIDDFPARVAPFSDPSVATNAVIMFAWRNGVPATTAPEEQDRILAYAELAHAAGFEFWVATSPPTTDSYAAVIDDINEWVQDNWQTFAERLIDFRSLSEMQDPEDSTYFLDGVHLKNAGYAVLAAHAHAEIT